MFVCVCASLTRSLSHTHSTASSRSPVESTSRLVWRTATFSGPLSWYVHCICSFVMVRTLNLLLCHGAYIVFAPLSWCVHCICSFITVRTWYPIHLSTCINCIQSFVMVHALYSVLRLGTYIVSGPLSLYNNPQSYTHLHWSSESAYLHIEN